VRIEPDRLTEKLEGRSEGGFFFHLVDLRREADYAEGHISGAVNVPMSKLPYIAEKIFGKTDEVIFYGYSSRDRAAVNAVLFMSNKGFTSVSLLSGGIQGWTGAVEKRNR